YLLSWCHDVSSAHQLRAGSYSDAVSGQYSEKESTPTHNSGWWESYLSHRAGHYQGHAAGPSTALPKCRSDARRIAAVLAQPGGCSCNGSDPSNVSECDNYRAYQWHHRSCDNSNLTTGRNLPQMWFSESSRGEVL